MRKKTGEASSRSVREGYDRWVDMHIQADIIMLEAAEPAATCAPMAAPPPCRTAAASHAKVQSQLELPRQATSGRSTSQWRAPAAAS